MYSMITLFKSKRTLKGDWTNQTTTDSVPQGIPRIETASVPTDEAKVQTLKESGDREEKLSSMKIFQTNANNALSAKSQSSNCDQNVATLTAAVQRHLLKFLRHGCHLCCTCAGAFTTFDWLAHVSEPDTHTHTHTHTPSTPTHGKWIIMCTRLRWYPGQPWRRRQASRLSRLEAGERRQKRRERRGCGTTSV